MKIEEQVLSREQMAHLKELGVDTSDASMVWMINKDNPTIKDVVVNDPLFYVGDYSCDLIPAYTIGDLIEKLPKKLPLKECFGFVFLNLYGYIGLTDEGISVEEIGIEYRSFGWPDKKIYSIYVDNGDNFDIPFIDRLYSALCWVAENHKELIK